MAPCAGQNFQIVQLLRRRRVTTARQLAERLEVSERTIYRDIAALAGSGVPVTGEPGTGYRLLDFDLPPLMFTREEIEAVVLGLRIVESWGDADLAAAASSARSPMGIASTAVIWCSLFRTLDGSMPPGCASFPPPS